MPWIAIHQGERKGAWQVPAKTDAECPECGGRVRVWRESESGTARHFKHIDNIGGGESDGSHDCESVAESDKHLKWKNFAAEKLSTEFGANVSECRVEKKLDAPWTDKERRLGDAVVTFDDRDEQLGQGIVVEVQHKNTSKNIRGTTLDYINQGYSLVWASADDFSDSHCKLSEIDFRSRAKESVWPEYSRYGLQVASDSRFESLYPHHRGYLMDIRAEEDHIVQVPAKLPVDYYDEMSREIWRNQKWPEDIFTPPPDYTSFWDYSKVPATIPGHWFLPSTKEYWDNSDWQDRFRHFELEEWRIRYTCFGTKPDKSFGDEDKPSLLSKIPLNKWLVEADDESATIRQLLSAHHKGLSERTDRYGKECPHCGNWRLHDPIHEGEVVRGRLCKHCRNWYTVVDKRTTVD